MNVGQGFVYWSTSWTKWCCCWFRCCFSVRKVCYGAGLLTVSVIFNNHFSIQAILTVRTPITEDGRPNTTGLTDGLNSVTLAVAMQRPDLSFSPVVRFGNAILLSTVYVY